MILKLMKYDFKRMTAIVKWFYPIAIFLAVVSVRTVLSVQMVNTSSADKFQRESPGI